MRFPSFRLIMILKILREGCSHDEFVLSHYTSWSFWSLMCILWFCVTSAGEKERQIIVSSHKFMLVYVLIRSEVVSSGKLSARVFLVWLKLHGDNMSEILSGESNDFQIRLCGNRLSSSFCLRKFSGRIDSILCLFAAAICFREFFCFKLYGLNPFDDQKQTPFD